MKYYKGIHFGNHILKVVDGNRCYSYNKISHQWDYKGAGSWVIYAVKDTWAELSEQEAFIEIL